MADAGFSTPSEIPVAEVVTTDAVVIGSGGGLAAAVAAAETGIRVIVLEKRRKVGGNTALARGFMAAESPAQRRMKIDARRKDIFKTAMAYAHWRVNPRIIKALVDKSGDTVRWFEAMGVVISEIPHEYANQLPRIYHIPEGYGAALTAALQDRCRKLGVPIWCRTTAKGILTGEKGEVIGVSALKDNVPVVIHAKCVVIATGGYSGNKRMLRKYYPHYSDDLKLYGIPNAGDGYAMAVRAGAASEGLGMILAMGPLFKGSLYVHAAAMEPNTLWLNRLGRRFINEDAVIPSETSNALNRQPDRICYSLFDDRIKKGFVEEGLIKAIESRYPASTKMTDLDRHLQKEVASGHVMAASRWEEIAQWMGLAPEGLQVAIETYNCHCRQGYDDLFYKDRRYLQPLATPPYYAVKGGQAFHGTIGGIKIDHHMRVLDHQDQPIAGLFAVGNDTGGWVADTYYYNLTGTALSFALNSGRIAGENLSHFIRGEQ